MSSDHSDYISKATNRLVELLSSNTIRREEKERYITSLTERFISNVFSPEKIEPYDVLFAKESILFIDELLNKYSKMQPLDTDRLNEVVLLCERQKQNISFLNSEKVSLPRIKISDIDQYYDSIKLNYDNNSFLNQTLQLDSLITESLNKITSYNDEECSYIFSLLDELEPRISECKRREINYSKVKNADIGIIKKKINSNRTKLENDAYLAKTYSIDNEICQIIDGPSRFDTTSLTKALGLLDELDPRIIECRSRGINLDKLRNKNTNDTRRIIAAHKQAIVDRNGLYGEITELDNQIVNACRLWNSDPNQLTAIVSLCDKCALLINDYRNHGWKVPALKCINPIDTKNKYLCYDEMLKIDKSISVLVNDPSREKHKSLLDNVKKQKGYILLCSQNKWAIPELMNKDLDEAIISHNKLLSKKHRKFKVAIISVLIVLACIITIGSVLGLRYRFYKTHSRMPISSEDSVGGNYLDIIETLENAGFSNIKICSVSSGIQASGSVTGITVNGSESFKNDVYYSLESEIIVYYSSKDRIDLTSSLNDWENATIGTVYSNLIGKGFDIKHDEISNSTLSNNSKMISIRINGVNYHSGECFVPEGAEIVLSYYGDACRLEDNAEDLIGEDYKTVRKTFLDLGFDNVVVKRKDDLVTGWISKDGSVASITISGRPDFKEGDVYFHNVEIVITVHTFKDQEYKYIDN